MGTVAASGTPRTRDRRLHQAHVALAGVTQELLMADGVITDLLRLVASTPMLLAARHRVRRKTGQPNLMSDEELQKLQRLLLRGKFRFRPATWKRIGSKDYARQHVWDRVVSYALLWCLEAAWTPVRHGSAYGWPAGRGTFDCMNTLATNLPQPGGPRDGFVVTMDAHHAFEHIRHDIVTKQLEKKIGDQSVLDLVAYFLQSVATEEGIGVGRGSVLAPVLADVAFSYIDWNWPEIGVRHLLQSCFLHPSSDQPQGVTSPPGELPIPDWVRAMFAVGDHSRPQSAPETPTDRKTNRSAHQNHGGTHTTATRPVTWMQVPVPTGSRPPCPLMDRTGSDTRDRGSGLNLPIYVRYGDDFLVAGRGGPERAAWAYEALRQQLAEIGLRVNPKKTTTGSLYDGFSFLGVRWQVDRDTGVLWRTPPLDRQANVSKEIRNVMWKTFREDPRNRLAVVEAVRDKVVRRTQYLRQAGADDGEIGSDAFDQLMRLADWCDWPIDQTDICQHVFGAPFRRR